MGFLKTIDDLLRGRLTRKEDLAAGRIEVPVRTLALVGLLLGALYGLFMGMYAPMREGNPSYMQVLATALKVPLLFILTLLVTYPSLYVVSAMFDSKLRHAETLRLLLIAMVANLALLASLGPVTGFFTLCTESYPFMLVLNVLFFGVCGFVGLGFLQRSLRAVFEHDPQTATPLALPADPQTATPPALPADPQAVVGPDAPPPRPRRPAAFRVFMLWILIYGAVGAQMGWVLRPFIGSPNLAFQWFREGRDSNFFAALFRSIGQLFS